MSMTGFGRGTAVRRGLRVEVELSTVNRKQLDVRVNLPRGLAGLEAAVQLYLQERLSRGQVTATVRVAAAAGGNAAGLSLDAAAAAQGVRAVRALARRLELPDNLGADLLLQLPGVVTARDVTEHPDQVRPALQAALPVALAALLRMRRREGARLGRDVRGRLRRLAQLARGIGARAPLVHRAHEAALRERLARAGAAVGRGDPQLLREVVLFADKADITEELVRLRSHFAHAAELMAAPAPAGRALDFLCQELFREINTVGAKCADGVVARSVVAFKAQLEAVREQVQNLE